MLIDNIGTLVTNDPELGTMSGAALVFEDGEVVQRADKGPSRGAGTERFDAGGGPSSPGSSTATATWCSPGTARRSSPPAWRARPYSAGGIKTTVEATSAASDEQLGAQPRPARSHEALRSGTTTVETKSGYGLTVHDERRSLAGRDTANAGDHVPRRPRRPAGVRRRRLRRSGQGRDARRLRAARALDRRLLRAGRLRRRPDPRDPRGGHREGPDAARARQPARPRPGRPDRGRAAAPRPRTTSPTSPTTTSTRSRTPTRSPRCSRARSSPPARRYPDARRLIDAGVTVALAADCNPGSSYTTNIPFCIAIAVREMDMTPDEAVCARPRGGALALRRTDIGHLAPAPGPTRCCSTPRATSISPTARASRSSPRCSRTAARFSQGPGSSFASSANVNCT